MILVDTKYELVVAADGSVVLIDEVHTPDSSRFWKAILTKRALSLAKTRKILTRNLFVWHMQKKAIAAMVRFRPCLMICGYLPVRDTFNIYELLTGQEFIPGPYPVQERLIENLKQSGYIE